MLRSSLLLRRGLAAAVLLVAVSSMVPAHARWGYRPPASDRADGVVDTWVVSGDHVVGRSQIDASPTPTLAVSMVSGGKRVFAWRVSNVAHAPQIMMRAD